MKRRIVFSMLAVAGLAAFASAKSADAATIFNRNARHGCCEPACCEPEPVCCEEEVSCCEDPCCRERRRPMRDLCAGIRGMFHRDCCDDGCDDCCEPVCCDPEPDCCGH